MRLLETLPSPDAYKMPKSVEIVMVDSVEALRHAVLEMEMEPVLGWDCEWISIDRDTVAHTIQIAAAQKVWIIDGVWLMENPDDEVQANELFDYLFKHSEHCNIFLGAEDTKVLKRYFITRNLDYSFSQMKCWHVFPNMIELNKFCKQLGMREMSLANYVAFFLK